MPRRRRSKPSPADIEALLEQARSEVDPWQSSRTRPVSTRLFGGNTGLIDPADPDYLTTRVATADVGGSPSGSKVAAAAAPEARISLVRQLAEQGAAGLAALGPEPKRIGELGRTGRLAVRGAKRPGLIGKLFNVQGPGGRLKGAGAIGAAEEAGLLKSAGLSGLGKVGVGIGIPIAANLLASQLEDESSPIDEIIRGAGTGAGFGAFIPGPWGIVGGGLLGAGWGLKEYFDQESPEQKQQKAIDETIKQLVGYVTTANAIGDVEGARAMGTGIKKFEDLVKQDVPMELAMEAAVAAPIDTITTHMQGGFTPAEQEARAAWEFELLNQRAAQYMQPFLAQSQQSHDALMNKFGADIGNLPGGLQPLMRANLDQMGLLSNLTRGVQMNPYSALVKEYAPYLNSRYLNSANAQAAADAQAAQQYLQTAAYEPYKADTQSADSLTDMLTQLPGQVIPGLGG